jgi:hypothetical protein
MSEWRKTAIQMIPQLRRIIELAENKTLLWSELVNAFFVGLDSGNTKDCGSIRDYYRWCVSSEREPLPNDVQTSAVLGFLERFAHRPKYITQLPNWLTYREVAEYSWNIKYAGGESAMATIKSAYGEP